MKEILANQRAFFDSGKTRSLEFRKDALQRLKHAIRRLRAEIAQALHADLKKSEAETFLGETSFAIEEINHSLSHLRSWMKVKRVGTPIVSWFGSSHIYSEPMGVVLIIAPWNYPFQLAVGPLVGAIAAGNCAIVKPSELAPNTSKMLAKLVGETFDPNYIEVVEGGVEVSEALLAEKLDHIFFTGSTAVGKHIMAAAARHLTPVTLELGGKSPDIVDNTADLNVAARRIVWGKFFNAGQTCVAPDYVLAPNGLKAELVAGFRKSLSEFFGDNPVNSPDYARIINQRHFMRLAALIDRSRVAIGGEVSEAGLYISPTVLVDVPHDHVSMENEIFGPILPVIGYEQISEAMNFVKARPKPLALYLFSGDRAQCDETLARLSFGGGCINDTLVHLANPRLPFGGVGESGMGAYHGKYSFDTFSHRKGIVKRSAWFDPRLRYPPYKNRLGIFKRLLG